jgi:hypothetical protein
VSIIVESFLRKTHVSISNKIVQRRDGSKSIERKLTGSLSVADYLWVSTHSLQILERFDTNDALEFF